jgi:hypothetical protein
MGRYPMRSFAPLLSLSLVLVAGMLVAGCGSSVLSDTETATEAKAAGASSTVEVAPVEAAVETAAAASGATVAASTADNAGAWSTVDAGAQVFAASLDQATQSIASCHTDAAAGQDFEKCAGDTYTAVAMAGTTLLDSMATVTDETDGSCQEALTTMSGAMQTMVTDYLRAVTTTDLTSAETLDARLDDDTHAYAHAALTAASTCSN